MLSSQSERNKYCNHTFIGEAFSGLGPVGFTSQVEDVFVRIYGLK